MSAFRDIRILPVVLAAIAGLAVLKIAGIALEGGYVFDYSPTPTKESWAKDNFNFPGRRVADHESNDVTGSVNAKTEKTDAAPPAPVPAAPSIKPGGKQVSLDPPSPMLPSERTILEKLQERRQELEARAREIEIRESLLKSAEQRLGTRVEELKGVESRITSAADHKGEADAARFKGIVTMYESMKPKDAAKIFDRLEMQVLFEIASQIAPRKMSDIMGQMQPEAAEKLTVELARRASGGTRAASIADLPKIEGKPTVQGAEPAN